jgi:hypothetical protein
MRKLRIKEVMNLPTVTQPGWQYKIQVIWIQSRGPVALCCATSSTAEGNLVSTLTCKVRPLGRMILLGVIVNIAMMHLDQIVNFAA